jgi:hypothetical protein
MQPGVKHLCIKSDLPARLQHPLLISSKLLRRRQSRAEGFEHS